MSDKLVTIIIVIVMIIASALAVVGVIKLNEADNKRNNVDYILAPKNHTCSVEEMKKVNAETLFCNENTSYFKSYCYGTAIMRNCQLTTPKEQENGY